MIHSSQIVSTGSVYKYKSGGIAVSAGTIKVEDLRLHWMDIEAESGWGSQSETQERNAQRKR